MFSQFEFSGVVKDKNTGTELEKVLVVVKPLKIKKAGYYGGVYTEKDGLFTVRTTYDLPLELVLTKRGCKSKKVKIRDKKIFFDISLDCEQETIEQIITERKSDNDNDGIINSEDECPDEYGVKENNGCPSLDSDGDGILNSEDNCPDEAGDSDNKGCPWEDDDGDGVLDRDDNCPNEPGDKANKGCPLKAKSITDIISKENSIILFQANSSVVNEIGQAAIRSLAEKLKIHKDLSIIIEGHSSSDGSESYNQNLSEKRANSVKTSLENLGIDGSRIKAFGYGEGKPIDINNTSAGRANNRRAAFSLSN
jgi:outer membrane protein OmpA-like peptidoglycan-associated protein